MTWRPEVIEGGRDPVGQAIRATVAMQRASAITVSCRYCGAIVGDRCVDVRGNLIEKQPAHVARLQDAHVI